MRVVPVAGATRTAAVPGISAAGADADAMVHTPAADLEVLAFGRPVRSPVVPVSPTGCPTPAVVTRAVRELVGFRATAVEAGLAAPTAAPTVVVGTDPGADIRERLAVPDAGSTMAAARRVGRGLTCDDLLVAETIPGGTTTALAVLEALGERPAVSSSLADNPVALKRDVVEGALAASDLDPGDCSGDPERAVRLVGDPVLAAVAGLTRGALEAGGRVTLGGGTQLCAAAALVRHAGVGDELALATTSFVADDETAELAGLADDLNLRLLVTDPGFEASDHPAMAAYVRGEAKEGVGMGGALALADRAGIPMAAVRDRVETVYDRLVERPRSP